jgi:two-component system chemotaxis response regulator CheY
MEQKEGSVMRVLLADDDPHMRKALKNLLNSAKHSAEVVDSGEELLRLLAYGKYDAVVTDYEMPGMSGLAVLKVVRRNAQYDDLPVIVFTATVDLETAIKAAGGIFAKKPGGLIAALETLKREPPGSC